MYLGTNVEVVENYTPPENRPLATPGDSRWVWCRWPDGKMWKHWRRQLKA